jgi:hypothetical protein
MLTVIVLMAATVLAQARPESSCSPVQATQRTIWVHQHIVLDLHDKPLKTMSGAVLDGYKRPVGRTLVEVFAYDGHQLPMLTNELDAMQRVAACFTDGTAGFKFALPPGRYEIRASKDAWNTTSVLVVISPKGKKRTLTIPLQGGT